MSRRDTPRRTRRRFVLFGAILAAFVAYVLPGAPSSKAATPPGPYLEFFPVSPSRILDTRPDQTQVVDDRSGALQPGEQIVVQVVGRGSIPADARAVVMNVTVVLPTAPGHVTIFPADAPLPNVSNINFRPGEIRPNVVQVGLSATGQVRAFNGSAGTVELIFDVSGYYANVRRVGAIFYPAAPQRVVDSASKPHLICTNPACTTTRTAIEPFHGNFVSRAVDSVPASILVAQTATKPVAIAMNLTVDKPQGDGFLVASPADILGATSNLNFKAGETRANAAIVGVGPSTPNPPGGNVVSIQAATSASSGDSRVIVDRVGIFAVGDPGSDEERGGSFIAVPPCRLVDTRLGALQTGPLVGPLPRGATPKINVLLKCNIDSSANLYRLKAIAANVTVVNASGPGFVSMLPTAPSAEPTVSSVNFSDANPIANHVLIPTDLLAGFVAWNSAASIDLIIDVFGFYYAIG